MFTSLDSPAFFISVPDQDQLYPHGLENEDFAAEIMALIPEYVQGRRAELRRLERALAAHDFDTVESIGHNFKGTGSSFGFPQLTAAGARMECAAREKDRETILRLAAAIETAIEQK